MGTAVTIMLGSLLWLSLGAGVCALWAMLARGDRMAVVPAPVAPPVPARPRSRPRRRRHARGRPACRAHRAARPCAPRSRRARRHVSS